MSTWRILTGDVRETLATLPEQSVQTCVTSPPYWGLRDYGTAQWDGGDPECDHRPPDEAGKANKPTAGQREHAGRFSGQLCWRCGATRIDQQLGLESTPEAYVNAMVSVFRDVRRVLKDDGTLWLNLGDSYCGGGGYAPDAPCNKARAEGDQWGVMNPFSVRQGKARKKARPGYTPSGLKPKDLVGIPWMVAFALRADGWYLRSDIIWSKPNPMPESVTDRPTKAHEYLFLLSKSARYHYDADAIAEPIALSQVGRVREDVIGGTSHQERGQHSKVSVYKSGNKDRVFGINPSSPHRASGVPWEGSTRNKRSVWEVTTQPYPDAHFATYPEKLIEPCILAGSRIGDTVLDPFTGSGTTGAVAIRHQRNFVGCELNPDYVQLAHTRIADVAPLFSEAIA